MDAELIWPAQTERPYGIRGHAPTSRRNHPDGDATAPWPASRTGAPRRGRPERGTPPPRPTAQPARWPHPAPVPLPVARHPPPASWHAEKRNNVRCIEAVRRSRRDVRCCRSGTSAPDPLCRPARVVFGRAKSRLRSGRSNRLALPPATRRHAARRPGALESGDSRRRAREPGGSEVPAGPSELCIHRRGSRPRSRRKGGGPPVS
jgi:hypothetical protein